MYETNYRGIRYRFQEDCLILNDKVIDYTLISNIRHRGGADPAFIFEYSGRQFAMPYPPEELGAILPYMKKASQTVPAPAPVEPEPPAPVEPKKSKKKLFIVIGAIVAALLIAVALVTLIGGGKEEYDAENLEDPGVEIMEEDNLDAPSPDVDPDATYDSIFEEYTARMKEEAPKLAEEYTKEAEKLSTVEEKAQLSNDKISRLAEISNEGVEKMAEIMYANGDDYEVYEEWSMKLMNVYQEQAQLITDAYTDSAS
ncbi:MAG: hypothetical protein IJ128_07550 [Firmicutes bacterium]|nr:hypothetical protein [Bacillota bacterium]